jgi:hypothetical protein
MSKPNVELLTEWLGPEGAVAGLDRSHITNAELMVLAREAGFIVEKKTSRKQIIIELVMRPLKRIDKTPDYLLAMSKDELQRYFTDRLVSDGELIDLLNLLGIAPTGRNRMKLVDFASSEISDLGMFQRVAKGSSEKRS